MDITSLIGIGGAFAIVMTCIVLEGGNPLSYINIPAALTALGGAIMATCLAYSMDDVKKLMPAFMKLIKGQHVDLVKTVEQLVEMCSTVRRDGLLALDALAANLDDAFFVKGVQYVVDGLDPDTLKQALQADIDARKHRHATVRGMFDFMGAVAPGYALVGTLLGLVAMLADLNPATVGHKMSLALLCTLYGCGVANAFFVPAAKKLGNKSEEELFQCRIVLEGLLRIQAGESPRILEDRLKAYLPAQLRSKVSGMSASRGEGG
ncbi:MAG: MotA/TolQ/ExbB proton channel family protein [Armatimonadetes bacterium]|nr:MotA/TolQ/ExbB proton channel family protein [Armatimonadota bacterium]